MPLHLTSLGSSFAAGPGLRPLSNAAAMRSTLNYPSLLAIALDAKHTDLTVSGATLLNITSEPQVIFGTKFETQISQLPADTDLVTITGGGNDIGYVGGIMADELRSSSIGRFASTFTTELASKDSSFKEDQLVERFIATIDDVRAKAPKAHIMLVEYLTLFGTDTKAGSDVWMGEDRIAYHREVAAMLQRAYTRAAEQRDNVEVVPVAEASKGHGIGSPEPWVDSWSLSMMMSRRTPFHPNEMGMKAVAELVHERAVALTFT